MCSSSTQLRWLSSLVLSCESCWEDGGVESVETPCVSCSEGRPSSTAGLISFSCNDFALWSQTDKKKEYNSLFRTHSCMILTNTTRMKGKHMMRGWNMYEKQDGVTYSQLWCVSRRIFKKIEVMQARHHMKDATNITLPSSNCLAFQQIRSSTC